MLVYPDLLRAPLHAKFEIMDVGSQGLRLSTMTRLRRRGQVGKLLRMAGLCLRKVFPRRLQVALEMSLFKGQSVASCFGIGECLSERMELGFGVGESCSGLRVGVALLCEFILESLDGLAKADDLRFSIAESSRGRRKLLFQGSEDELPLLQRVFDLL